jgi:hypothetical protein
MSPGPFAGAPGEYAGELSEVTKGEPTIYTQTPGSSVAVRLVPSNPARRSLLVQNAHATIAVAYGFTSALTFATGLVIPPNTTVPFPLDRWTDEVWIIAQSGTGDVRAVETTSV